jgi:hypothetical protein
MTMHRGATIVLASLLAAVHANAQPKPAAKGDRIDKVDIVATIGCVTRSTGEKWVLTDATDPVLTSPKSQAPATAVPAVGKNRYTLIGLTEFNVPSYKGHTVRVEGLSISAGAEKRINITSLKDVAPTCPPSAGTSAKPPVLR